MNCPLCYSTGPVFYHRDKHREYYLCRTCGLVLVPPEYHLSPAEEKKRYDLHENHPEDPGYRKFLSRLFEPVRERLEQGAYGLDFGCGPGPALAAMFREAGFTIETYDPFYDPDEQVLDASYDFITVSEVVEHLSEPRRELERLWAMLRPGGLLGIMTGMVLDREAFAGWHYINDDTHVCFFSEETFRWLAGQWQAAIDWMGKDVVIFRKRNLAL